MFYENQTPPHICAHLLLNRLALEDTLSRKPETLNPNPKAEAYQSVKAHRRFIEDVFLLKTNIIVSQITNS